MRPARDEKPTVGNVTGAQATTTPTVAAPDPIPPGRRARPPSVSALRQPGPLARTRLAARLLPMRAGVPRGPAGGRQSVRSAEGTIKRSVKGKVNEPQPTPRELEALEERPIGPSRREAR